MTDEMTKSKILELIQSEHKLLEDQLGGLSEDELLQPSLSGNWNIKDILMHIVFWEERMVEWIEVALRDEIPQMLPPGLTWDDLDIWNEQTNLENKDKPLPEVLSRFHSSYLQAFEIVEKIQEEDLINPNRFEWREGKPLWQIVSSNTHWHYAEHREQITDWLNSTRESSSNTS